MKLKQQLEIQALVDGELAANDTARVQALVGNDREARALFDELGRTRLALKEGEPLIALPETHEFHFGQIRRRIEAGERRTAPAAGRGGPTIWSWLRGHAGTVGGTAFVVAAMALFGPAYFQPYIPGEVLDADGEMGAMTYHSERDGLTIVYLFDSTPDIEEDSDAKPADL